MALICDAATPSALDDVRSLMRAFVAWHRERHVEDVALIERYFDERAFEQELAALPGKYARPEGRLLIAYQDGHPAGCVALRDLDDGICEMKRMFVPMAYRGMGIGRALAGRPDHRGRARGRLSAHAARYQQAAKRSHAALRERRVPSDRALLRLAGRYEGLAGLLRTQPAATENATSREHRYMVGPGGIRLRPS